MGLTINIVCLILYMTKDARPCVKLALHTVYHCYFGVIQSNFIDD